MVSGPVLGLVISLVCSWESFAVPAAWSATFLRCFNLLTVDMTRNIIIDLTTSHLYVSNSNADQLFREVRKKGKQMNKMQIIFLPSIEHVGKILYYICYQLTDMIVENKHHHNYHNQISQDQCSDLDIFEMLSSALVTIAKSQQILQCMREILVMDPSFTPMSLFKYLSFGATTLTRKHLLTFLDENSLVADDKETDDFLKRIFNRYGISSGNGISYTAYLSFLYPFNSGVLRELLSNRVKKYTQLDRANKQYRPSDSVLTAFLLLLEEEVKSEKKIEVQINDSRFPGRERLKKIMKSIKKASQKTTPTLVEKSENAISMLELRNFIKAFIDVEDHIFLDLGRRLGLTKSGQISLQTLEIALKKIKKPHGDAAELNEIEKQENTEEKVEVQGEGKGNNRQAREKSFKEELYRELAKTLSLNVSHQMRNKTPRSRSVYRDPVQNQSGNNLKNVTPSKRNGSKKGAMDNSLTEIEIPGSFLNQNNRGQSNNHRNARNRLIGIAPEQPKSIQNPKISQPTHLNHQANSIFRQFVTAFLKGHRDIEKCKSKLVSFGNIDYLSLFKTLDNGRGVIDAGAMHTLYIKLAGIPTDLDFHLIIERFAQPEEKWLSYSQFSDIFKNSCMKSDEQYEPKGPCNFQDINGIKLHPESVRLLGRIIYLYLDLEDELRQIVRKLKKVDIEWLFSQINVDCESKGFINYQELKKYLSEQLGLNVGMIDLMALLKRLDKSKNGVVVKEEFLIC